MLRGYARVSTDNQDAGLEVQIRDLQAIGCEKIYREHVSSVAERPQFNKALDDLQPGDTLVVTKIDRFARSNIGFWKTVEAINARGAYLRVLNLGGETIDTKSATGRLILTVFAGFAQFEREIMLERQRDGIAKAKSDGKYQGRASPKWAAKSYSQKRSVMALYDAKLPKTLIAKQLGLSRSTVDRVCKAARAGVSVSVPVEMDVDAFLKAFG